MAVVGVELVAVDGYSEDRDPFGLWL